MTPIANQQNIAANGEYSLFVSTPARTVLLEWHISAGSATVTPGYVNLSGGFTPFLLIDGSSPAFHASGGICEMPLPASGAVALKVESAAGLAMQACQTVRTVA